MERDSHHRNYILGKLGPEPAHFGSLVRLRRGQVLQDAQAPIRSVYFPVAGVLSMLTVLEDGTSVEVACVGMEGMAGLPVFLGAQVSQTRVVVQVNGTACRVPANDFRRRLESDRELHRIMARYTDIVLIQAAQISACNRRHSVVHRCARILQEWSARLPSGRLPVTHDSLADSLGARRSSVSEAMAELQEMGCLRYGRGYTVINQRRLARAACECHGVISEAMAATEW
jgi:CRP-like cAMP-binding protein